MSVTPWKRIEPTIDTKIDYRHVVIKTFEVPGKQKKLTIATFHKEGISHAGVIALTKDKQVIIARQYRHGPEKIMDELPGGTIDGDEEPETAARRELLEETGYEPGGMEYLGASSKDAYMNGKWHFFLATDCVLSEQHADGDEDEIIEIHLISITELLDIAKHDGMTDAVAVLMAYDKLKEIDTRS
jgi:ADP-ribose pyrophosphatase